jgi:hypothetical protein
MPSFVVTARLKRGRLEHVREILREEPPFDAAETALQRQQVFLGRDEVVFLFDGPQADEVGRRLLDDSGILGRRGRIARHLSGSPRTAYEVFSWDRPVELEGVSFQGSPGPGYSDGG